MQTLLHSGRYLLQLPDGRKGFLKICGSERPDFDTSFQSILRERVYLEHLQGLAVPELVSLSRRQVPAPFRADRSAVFIALVDHGRDFGHIGLSPQEMLAANLFVVEQLVAFRRCQVLYTDVKCANVVARRRPLRVTIIDFGSALPRVGGRAKIPWLHAGHTKGYEAPETGEGGVRSERALVYQLGMMMAHTLSNARINNTTLRHERYGLPSVLRRLERLGAGSIADLLSSCVRHDPRERPRNYEDVLARIDRASLQRNVLRTWEALRKPFADRLTDLGLDWP
ncbi:MAG: serine/threonine protein kinase [Deltaproteobacteria bacterium]|nr:serine/threonine protein kinase [Deltaproteobacteria bacterium]